MHSSTVLLLLTCMVLVLGQSLDSSRTHWCFNYKKRCKNQRFADDKTDDVYGLPDNMSKGEVVSVGTSGYIASWIWLEPPSNSSNASPKNKSQNTNTTRQCIPKEIGVSWNYAALTGLPLARTTNWTEKYNYILSIPQSGINFGFDHIDFEYYPHGLQNYPYDTPLVSPHFYFLSQHTRNSILEPYLECAVAADLSDVPLGYKRFSDCAERTGITYLKNSTSINRDNWNATWAYGFYKGEYAFLAPMISRDFLYWIRAQGEQRKRVMAFSYNIDQPFKISLEHYPRRWSLIYIPGCQQYLVKLSRWQTTEDNT